MLKNRELNFENRGQVIDHIANNMDNYVILGGHFILDFESDVNQLQPLIQHTQNITNFNEIAKIEAGSFPVDSFKLSLDLVELAKYKNGIPPRILLLVNDHKFPSVTKSSIKSRMSDLRKSYFRANSVPSIFLTLLRDKKLSIQDVILPNIGSNNEDSILQSGSNLYSEYVLRKRFDRNLKKKILKLDEFLAIPGKSGKTNIYFRSEENSPRCLLEEEECGCSGEVMQLIQDVVTHHNINNFCLIVPSECANAVKTGVQAILIYLKKRFDLNCSVTILSGLESDPYSDFFFKGPVVFEINN